MTGQPSATKPMILRSTVTSPYGRKVRMAMQVHQLTDSISIESANTLDEHDSLRLQNPLGKIPCLILATGEILFDSRVIVEYLDSLSDKKPLIPARGLERFQVLTQAALCDGLTDAALLLVYEGRFRSPAQLSERWTSHQRAKVLRALSALAAAPPPPERTDLASIALACALGYLDWRQPVAWRENFPALIDWLDRFSRHEPAVALTAV